MKYLRIEKGGQLMKRLALVGLAGVVAAVVAAGSLGASKSPVTIVMWHGYTDVEGKALKAQIDQYNRSQSTVHVNLQFYGNADYALQKVLTAISGGKYPDIAYLYGSWAANIAKSPKTLDLTQRVKEPGFNFNGIWPAARLAATVNG